MDHVKGLSCMNCGKQLPPTHTDYTCDACGVPGILDVLYDYDLIRKRTRKDGLEGQDAWRYLPFLPVDPAAPPPRLSVGGTPLYHPERLCRELEFPGLHIKDDGRNPTGSLKDRASVVGLARAIAAGARTVTAASTGNAACSLAGLSAAAGIPCFIFVPKRAPRPKVAQLLVFGAQVFQVEGTYEQCFDLSVEASRRFGWYNRNCAYNPYLVEGKKTVGLEIAEQLGWQAPDRVYVSVGDGCIISGVYKAFHDLKAVGWLDKLPRLIAVQAEGAAPVVKAFRDQRPIEPIEPNTLADSIACGIPRNGLKALRALRESGGDAVTVTDQQILAAMRRLAGSAGVFGEPAGVTAFAGFLKQLAAGQVPRGERAVVLVTGNGLKDIDSAFKAVGEPMRVEPSMAAVEKLVSRAG
ncbi:MAG: threonine synthase [Candidatus Wallbacteria bacterium]|nr:threonine synthase [Candidatus Wallbacteria bacterium]